MTLEDRKKQKELNHLVKKNEIGKIVEFIKQNGDNEALDFNILEDVYGVWDSTFVKIFDEKGELKLEDERNISRILFNRRLKEFVLKMYPAWVETLSPLYKKYVDFSLKNPEVDEAFEVIPYNQLEECFDGEKVNETFYSNVFKNLDICKNLIKNPLFRKEFNELEIKFIKKGNKLDDGIDDFLYFKEFERGKLSKYFDGHKLLPSYYRNRINLELFNIGISDDFERLYKYCSNKEIAFLNRIRDNDNLTRLCKKYEITIDNIDEYFDFENNELKLKQAVVKRLLDENSYDLLQFLDNEDYLTYGLSENDILILNTIKEIKGIKTKQAFLEVLKSKIEIVNYNKEEMDSFIELLNIMLNELENTNSKEIHKFKDDILITLMGHSNPQKTLELMNEVYTKNNLPDVGKAYLIFKILHRDYSEYDFYDYSKISQVLKNCKNDNERDIIIFSDLLKASFGSNNRGIRDYLINIKEGNELFLSGDFYALNDKEKQTLKIFVKHLYALYNNTLKGKENPLQETGELRVDLEILNNAFGVTERYNLPDRIVRSFGYFAGFKTFNAAWEYFVNKIDITDKKNRLHAEKVMLDEFKIEEGDFIKGIGDLTHFETILQNGSVAKEFLSIGSTSDATPLDTDLVRAGSRDTLENLVSDSKASSYGPIYFVLKNNDGITITRDEFGNVYESNSTNLEAFSTGKNGHYGIRTGFASSEIDYIVVDNKEVNDILPKMKHIIVNNGFYIPVIDSKDKNLLFSPKEYDLMKQKASGLKHYTNDDFVFSNNLLVDEKTNEIKENIDKNISDANEKKKKINKLLSEKFKEAGIDFKDYFDSDISLGNVQLIDTGSTGRGTQTGVSTDFDFIMRIDSNMEESNLKNIIFDALGVSKSEDIMKNVRLKSVVIDPNLEPVDIDISFVYKSDTNFYSTDAALKDRLEQIKKQDEGKYKDVIANIILAKNTLKEAGVYKPNHARENSEGGLGGVGIENWLLQYGGSFYDAALSFVEASRGKSFEEFSKEYKIWDYGYNFYTGDYDEFVSQNMTKEGYLKMRMALEEYLKTVKVIDKETIFENIPTLENDINLSTVESGSRSI